MIILHAEIANTSHILQLACLFSELNMSYVCNLSVSRKIDWDPFLWQNWDANVFACATYLRKLKENPWLAAEVENPPLLISTVSYQELVWAAASHPGHPLQSSSSCSAQRCLHRCVNWRGAPGSPVLGTEAIFCREWASLFWFRGPKGKTAFLLHRQVWKHKTEMRSNCEAEK